MIPKYSTLRYFSSIIMIKFNSQNSSENLYNSLNFAPCGPPYDPSDRCAARGGFAVSWKALL